MFPLLYFSRIRRLLLPGQLLLIRYVLFLPFSLPYNHTTFHINSHHLPTYSNCIHSPRRNLRNPQFHPRINPRIVQLRFVTIGNAVGLLMGNGLRHHHQVGVVLRVKRGRVDHTPKLLASLVNPVVMVAVALLGVARLRDHQLGVQVVIPSIVLLQAVNLARAEIVIYALPRRKINVSYGTVM